MARGNNIGQYRADVADPTKGTRIPTVSWWWGLSGQMAPRAMPTIAQLQAVSPMQADQG